MASTETLRAPRSRAVRSRTLVLRLPGSSICRARGRSLLGWPLARVLEQVALPHSSTKKPPPNEGGFFARSAYKPNSVWICILDDHSSRRAIADALQQPTRRFPPRCVSRRGVHVGAPGRHAQRQHLDRTAVSFLFGLAPCGVYPAPPVAVRAVRSYRTFSPLPAYAGGIFSVALAVSGP